MQFQNDAIREEIRQAQDVPWQLEQRQLQNWLDPKPLPDALRYLTAYHLEKGFLEDDSTDVRYFPCADRDGSRRVIAFFIPRRAKRVAVGRTGSCVFDINDLRRNQRGLQHPYRLKLNGRPYIALTNPNSYAPSHTSIASEDHEPQGWQEHDPAVRRAKIQRTVEDLHELSQRLPDWVAGYNAQGAGPTINHHHMHTFEFPAGLGQLPLQTAAREARTTSEAALRLRFGGDGSYPLTVYRVGGSRKAVIDEVTSLLVEWSNLDPHASTANLIAVTEESQVCLYVVLRNRFLEFSVGFPYRLGLMESAGIFIYSQEAELQELQQGRVSFERLWNILQAIHPPTARHLG